MKRPNQLAGMHVPRAHIARRPERRRFLRGSARDDEILVDDGRRLSPFRPGIPCVISGVFRSTMPLSPKASLSLPVLALTEYSLPSLEPKTICGAVCESPGQYSTPRVEGELVGR